MIYNKSPCYDEKTRTDCPRRHAGCAATCPEWAKYDEYRKSVYKERQNNSLVDSVIKESIFDSQAERAKRKLRMKRIKR